MTPLLLRFGLIIIIKIELRLIIYFFIQMELPDDVLGLVREFSRPITRPDWRHLHRMTSYRFHVGISTTYNDFDLPVIISFVENYDQHLYRYWFHTVGANRPYLFLRLNLEN